MRQSMEKHYNTSNGFSHNNGATGEKLDIFSLVPMGKLPLQPQTTEPEPATEPKPATLDNPLGWKLRSLKDAYAQREPQQFVVDGLLPIPSLNIAFGAPGSMKSMTLADMGAAVVSGDRWLPSLPSDKNAGVTFATKQSPVLWIDFDNGQRMSDERFEAVARTRNLPEDAPFHYVSMPIPWLDSSNREMVIKLSMLIKQLGAKLVIVDNLGLITGGVDENSPLMTGPMGNLRWLCEDAQCALVIIHHQRKGSGQGEGGRRGESLRGHSSIEAAINLALLIERKEGTNSLTFTATKVRGFIVASTFGAQFAYEHKSKSTELESARFFSEAVETKAAKEYSEIQAQVLNVLSENSEPVNQSDLVASVRGKLNPLFKEKTPGLNRVREVINNMASTGVITVEEGKKRAQMYRLATRSSVTGASVTHRNTQNKPSESEAGQKDACVTEAQNVP